MNAARSLVSFLWLSATVAAAAPALPTDAYGFELGRPLQLPACEYREGRGYSMPGPGGCTRGILSTQPPQRDTGIVALPYAEMPAGVGMLVYRLAADGTLALLIVSTAASSQSSLFDRLVGKYGQPASSGSVPLQNALGAKFEAIVARWESADVRVEFTGMTSLKDGMLLIGTPAAVEQYHERLRAIGDKGRKL